MRFRSTLLSAAILMMQQTTCFAAAYMVTDLGTLGGDFSTGNSVNNHGQVTGFSRLSAGPGSDVHAFLYDGAMYDLGAMLNSSNSNGQGISDALRVVGTGQAGAAGSHGSFFFDGSMHDLPTLGGSLTEAIAINNSGTIVGQSEQSGGSRHAFLYDGSMHDLGTLGNDPSSESIAYAISPSGLVTGSAAGRAFLYDGVMHDLSAPGAPATLGHGVNDSGHVSGVLEFGTISHAFYYDGTVHDIGTLGGDNSGVFGSAINGSNYVVGDSQINGGAYRAFLYRPGMGMVDLNALIDPASGWTLLEARAISDTGYITGDGLIGNERHAFLLSPVPEPSTLVLIVIGLVGISVVRFSRRRLQSSSAF